jgi:hypothetical protein
LNGGKKRVITQSDDGGQKGPVTWTPTQAEAIERAAEIDPDATILVERVRDTTKGSRDKWRKP